MNTTMTQLPLRDYQRDALAAVTGAWHKGVQRPAVVAPTGAGKTVMFSHLIADHLTAEPRSRAVVLVHRDELADQAMDKIRQVAPDLTVGKVKASDNDVHADVVVASVQTLARSSRLQQLLDSQYPGYDPERGESEYRPFSLVVVDECHHAVAPSWLEVMRELGALIGPEGTVWRDSDGEEVEWTTRFVGFTATLARGDEVGLGRVWQKVAYAISLTRLIRRGHLADVRGKHVVLEDLDLSDVKRSGGDYQTGALGDALSGAHMPEVVAQAYLEHAKDRQGVVFTPTVDTALETSYALCNAGIVAAVVTGTTPREVRREVYADYQSGRVQVLVNCMVLTEGFDAPWASCAVIARPTQSAPLYTQMVGRVLRPWPGKADALVLDVVGASTHHKLATLIDLAPGTVKAIGEGESLAEAEEAAELAAIADEEARAEWARQSRMAAKDVDLFAQSRNVWLRTPAGVWFVPTREGEYFLWPSSEPGRWDVCVAPMDGYKRLPWQRLHTGLSLDLAMSWAQTEAEEADASVASRDASWRKGKTKASEGQKGMLRRYYREDEYDENTITKADASDMISVDIAARVFDRHYRRLM